MTEPLSPAYREAFRAAVREAYEACPYANILVLCEEARAEGDTEAATILPWQVGRLTGKALNMGLLHGERLEEKAPTLGIGVPADLYARADEYQAELVQLAADVRKEILATVRMSAEDEAQFRAAARSALEGTRGSQVFMMAPTDRCQGAVPFSVHELRPGEYGIAIPATWICIPQIMAHATTLLLEESYDPSLRTGATDRDLN